MGLEGAFRHFGGVTHEVLVDNAKALVEEHNRETREVKLNDRFRSFCAYWGVAPRACAPYRAQTKGKDERGGGYVKRNAIAGHAFTSLDALQAHLDHWMREVADVRVHGTTRESPVMRFERDERQALRPLPSKAPFGVSSGCRLTAGKSGCSSNILDVAHDLPMSLFACSRMRR